MGFNNVMVGSLGQIFVKNPSSVLGINDDNTMIATSTNDDVDVRSKAPQQLFLLECFYHLTFRGDDAIYRCGVIKCSLLILHS